jgi:hypothetical protein
MNQYKSKIITERSEEKQIQEQLEEKERLEKQRAEEERIRKPEGKEFKRVRKYFERKKAREAEAKRIAAEKEL